MYYSDSIDNYEVFFKDQNVAYVKDGYRLLIGEFPLYEGWLLELCVIEMQLDSFIKMIVPYLLFNNVCFKIPVNRTQACSVVNGAHGIIPSGQLIVVYPTDVSSAVSMAEELVSITTPFRSADITGSSWLGGTVYTRFHKAGDEFAKLGCFSFPFDISWPFGKLNSPIIQKRSDVLNNRYRFVSLVKPNLKGDAIKAVYYKNIFNMGYCFIKQARKNTFVDKWGRDICWRLKWQYQLHARLASHISIPPVMDYFDVYGDQYMVMKLLKGTVFTMVIRELSGVFCWRHIDKLSKVRLLKCLLEILQSLKLLHENGLVHRDLSPENFMVTRKCVYLIDMELAYDVKATYPSPPYPGGTPGFKSPSQEKGEIPTVEDDVYGLGALMFVIFVNIPPAAIGNIKKHGDLLYDCVLFFCGSDSLAKLISTCLDADLRKRPSLEEITVEVKNYNNDIKKMDQRWVPSLSLEAPAFKLPSDLLIKTLMIYNEKNWVGDSMIWSNKLRLSVLSDALPVVSTDFKEGIAGVLYLLSVFKRIGYDVSTVMGAFKRNFDYLENYWLSSPFLSGGLYNGAAGIAVAVASCIEVGIIDSSELYKQRILTFLNSSYDGLSVESGASGHGFAILNSISIIGFEKAAELLDPIVNLLLEQQQENGAWLLLSDNQEKAGVLPGFSKGMAGIVCFLWQYSTLFDNKAAKSAAVAGTKWLMEYLQIGYKSKLVSLSFGDGIVGMVFTLLMAYTVTKEQYYGDFINKILIDMPTYVHDLDSSYHDGSAGVGDVYLMAWELLGIPEYKHRANWIAGKMVCLSVRDPNKGIYWLNAIGEMLRVGILCGNGGVQFFWMRYIHSRTVPSLFNCLSVNKFMNY